MTIEKLEDMQIAYMRRTGGYGEGNRQLMEQFKRYLREHALLREDTTILGIALDDPAEKPPAACRSAPLPAAAARYLKSPIRKRAYQISGGTFPNSQHGCLWTARDPFWSDMRA